MPDDPESEEGSSEEETEETKPTKDDAKADEKKDEAKKEPEKPAITYPANMSPYYKELLQGRPDIPFKPHDSYPEITGAEKVEYCEIDGLPPDFCQFGPAWDKAKPVCMEKFAHFYPELVGASLEDAKKGAAQAAEKSKVKELPGGKKKREASPSVTLKRLSRGGRKCVTVVCGLESFGVKLEPLAKIFKKKFACGVSVVKAEVAGQGDNVEIQGDFEDEVIEIICKEHKEIPKSKIAVLAEGTKKKGGK